MEGENAVSECDSERGLNTCCLHPRFTKQHSASEDKDEARTHTETLSQTPAPTPSGTELLCQTQRPKLSLCCLCRGTGTKHVPTDPDENHKRQSGSSVHGRAISDWNIQRVAAKINQSTRAERKGTNTIDSPPTSAPLLSLLLHPGPTGPLPTWNLKNSFKESQRKGLV